MIARLIDRVKLAVSKAIVKAVVDTGDIQILKISMLEGEEQDQVERIQNYGISSVAPVGSEAIMLSVGGDRSHGVVIACDSGAFRVKDLNTGEVVIYSQYGQTILLNKTGGIEIQASTGVKVGNGTTAAAIASKVDALWTALQTTCNAFIPPPTPDGGAALATAIATAITSVGIGASSSNLSVD